MLEKFRTWLLKPTADHIDRTVKVQMEAFDKQLAGLHTQVHSLLDKDRQQLIEQNQRQLEAVQPLRDAINTLESYGIRRKFGGVIDIDFDKLCKMLGDENLVQLEKSIHHYQVGKKKAS